MIEIGDGTARAVIAPSLGGGLARFDMRDGDDWRPAMRPYAEPNDGTPLAFALAMNVLAPFSNRISAGGFAWDGERYAIAPNVTGEMYPIHGDAWLAAWSVKAADDHAARLTHRGAIGPYRYDAMLEYAIEGGALTVRLAVRNAGDRTLPYGLGLHPWFVRDADTRLRAPAEAQWLEGEGHLPTRRIPLDDPQAHDTRPLAPLPDGWINAGYDGWSGRATLRWGDDAGVTVEALSGANGERLERYVLYSPAADAPFVCFEPVTHAIDAPNLTGGALAHGMIALGPDRSIAVACRFKPHTGDTA